MKTVLALLLCLILPFQAVWSMAAQFCQHENTSFTVADFDQPASMTAHFGHHLHPAHAGDDLEQPHAKPSSNVTDLSATDIKPLSHDDHIGHFDCGLRLEAPTQDLLHTEAWLTYRAFDPLLYQSPLLTPPETPSWPHLAAGGVAVL